MSEALFRLRRNKAESNGGEARIRTLVAAWAADLQSAAIDRSATSPISRAALRATSVFRLESFRCPYISLPAGVPKEMELAKGFEPPTG